ncbi:MAG: hypothetical protein BWY02_00749 [bacterium ADurb.Bin157]|nr:MAG: hypothetical protein BWY02_00749 [bacterium ADurb.Bin157]
MIRTLIYLLMSSAASILWGLNFKNSLKSGVSSVRLYRGMRHYTGPRIFAHRETEPVRFYFFIIWDLILSLFFMWLTFGLIREVLSSFF